MSESTQSPSELLNNASEMQDVTVCENGCVRVFPRKTASGMCQRCKRINVEGLSAEEKQRISEMPQCTTCGVVSAYFLYKNPYTCGPCYDALNGITPRSTNTALSTQAQLRFARPGVPPMGPPSARLASLPTQPTIPLHTEAMNSVRSSAAIPASQRIRMYFQVWIDNKKAQHVGVIERTVNDDILVETFLQDCLKTINPLTDETYPPGYERRDIQLKGIMNRVMPFTAEFMANITVGCFYRALQQDDDGGPFITGYPGNVKPKPQRFIHGELRLRTPKLAEPSAGPTTKKRKSAWAGKQLAAKKAHVTGPSLLSTFTMIRPSGRVLEDSASKVNIRIAKTQMARHADGDFFDVSWPDSIHKACIEKEKTASGSMKNVFKATITDGPGDIKGTWAFKNYFRVSDDGSAPSMKDNVIELIQDLERSHRGAFLLKMFFDACTKAKLTVYTHMSAISHFYHMANIHLELEFARTILIEEVIQDADDQPSVASGLTLNKWQAVSDAQNARRIVWLGEPFNASAPERFTGTMQFMCSREDLISQTIEAFVHFAHCASEVVYCDIEGMRGRLSNGIMGMLLFDAMTHSLDGSTGAGDHGIDGLEAFVEQHECNDICVGLTLHMEDDLEDWLDRLRG